MSSNKTLQLAKKTKNDEFYTRLEDIERELCHYKKHFRDKVVYCNCDDPYVSNFFKYFALNFEYLGLKKLITTCYRNEEPSLFSENKNVHGLYLIYEGDKDGDLMPNLNEVKVEKLKGDGDFRSPECIELLKQSDIVCTNPPFSLFREYINLLIQYDKQFLILGPVTAIGYRDIFPLIKENKLWLGYTQPKLFLMPDQNEKKFGNIEWYTNLEIKKRHEEMILFRKYNPKDYPKYDNYDAIEVSKVKDIPCDYPGIMGVPISFLDKYNPEQFEIVGIDRYVEDNPCPGKRFTLKGKECYARVLIRLRRYNVEQ